MIILRKEWFGGIIADSKSYDTRIINAFTFSSLSESVKTNGKFTIDQLDKLSNSGFSCNSEKIKVIEGFGENNKPVLSAPIILWVELTSKCPLKCKHCFINCTNLPSNEHLPYVDVDRILTEASEMGVVRITLSGGEAFEYPYIKKVINRVNELGMGLRVFTNGILKNKCFEWLREGVEIDTLFVSLDGGEIHHNELRGRNTYKHSWKTIEVLSKYDSIKNITLSISIDQRNADEFGELLLLCKENNISTLLIRPLMGYSWTEEANKFVFTNKRELLVALENIEKLSNEYGVECQFNKIPVFPLDKQLYIEDDRNNASLWSLLGINDSIDCVGGNLVCGVRYDGIVSPCGFIGLQHSAGTDNSIYKHSLSYLWIHSPNLQVMRNIELNYHCSNCGALSICNGGCRANSFNHDMNLSGIDPYCLHNATAYGNKVLPGKVTLIKSVNQSLNRKEFFVSKKRLVSKCGWATYE